MKIGVTLAACLASSWSSASLMVCSSIGQMSGQLVKPKKTSLYWPRKSASVRCLPDWSVSAKGPPTVDAASERTPRHKPTPTIAIASSRQTRATPRASGGCGRNRKRGVVSTGTFRSIRVEGAQQRARVRIAELALDQDGIGRCALAVIGGVPGIALEHAGTLERHAAEQSLGEGEG